jgi:lysophospholipase L1-like esterase
MEYNGFRGYKYNFYIKIYLLAGVSMKNWITSWSASPVRAESVQLWDGKPSISVVGFENQTIRMVFRSSTDGTRIRFQFSNLYGNKPLKLESVVLADEENQIDIFFDRSTNVTILPGQSILSDELTFQIKGRKEYTVSIYVQEYTGETTWHQNYVQTSSVAFGNKVRANQESFTQISGSWFWMTRVDIIPKSPSSRVLVTLGDSITAGVGGLPNHRGWGEYLQKRVANESSLPIFIANAGISGNRLMKDGLTPSRGDSSLKRLHRDVISIPGVTDVILLEGINDIGYSHGELIVTDFIDVYSSTAEVFKKHELNIFIGTLVPFKGFNLVSGYYSDEKEELRQEINHWIRNNNIYDGVIDFDKVLADPDDPKRQHTSLTFDNLHPNDSGYKAMAFAIELTLFSLLSKSYE